MVTTKFIDEFVKRKAVQNDGLNITENEGIQVKSDGRDVTRIYKPDQMVKEAISTFELNLEEALELSRNLDGFRQEGTRKKVIDSKTKTVKKYRRNYGSEKLADITENLRTNIDQHSVGNDIWNLLDTPEADILAENAEEEINQILNANSKWMEEEIENDLNGAYKQVAKEAYQELEDDITEIAGLAEISGYDSKLGMFDTLKWLKEKQENPNWEAEIELDKLGKRLRSEVDTQKRRKTLDALEIQARNITENYILRIRGEEPKQIDKDELHAVRAYKMTENDEDLHILEDIIKNDNNVYLKESSPSYDKIGSLENSEFEVLSNGLGTQEVEINGEKIKLRVATPIESLRYGDEFDTCKSLTWEEDFYTSNSAVIQRSASLDNPVLYAENEEGSIVGRDNIRLQEDDVAAKNVTKLKDSRKYTSLGSQEMDKELREEMNNYEEQMRTELGYITEDSRSDIADAIIETKVYEDWIAPELV